MATTEQHIAARSDMDLQARLTAAAEMNGVRNAYSWVVENVGALVSIEVDSGQTISDVYAYADTVRKQALAAVPDPPGKNPAGVTDEHLETAVLAVIGSMN